MSVPSLERFLALPPSEQSVLSLLVAVHAKVNRTRLAAWLTSADLRNAQGHRFSGAELSGAIESWLEAGLLTQVGRRDDNSHGYVLHDALRHELAAHLFASGKLAALAETVRAEEPLFGRYSYYTDPDRLAREIFLALYLGPSDD